MPASIDGRLFVCLHKVLLYSADPPIRSSSLLILEFVLMHFLLAYVVTKYSEKEKRMRRGKSDDIEDTRKDAKYIAAVTIGTRDVPASQR